MVNHRGPSRRRYRRRRPDGYRSWRSPTRLTATSARNTGPVVKACDEYQRAVPDYLTEEFLRTTAEKLRILSKRDGLKSPNANHIGQLLDILEDIANRFHVPRLLPGHGISQQEREQLLEANEQRFNIAVEQAKRRAATYIRAVNKMDSWHYLTYIRFKRFGITSRTFREVDSDFHPWTGPVT